jgi:Protein of unknown function (DUF3108)
MSFDQRGKRVAFFGRLVCTALFAMTPLGAGQSQRTRKAPAPPPKPPAKSGRAAAALVEAVVPFRAGEKLSFRVMWSKFSVNAGTLEFLIAAHGNFFGQPAWHFQAHAQTVDTMHIVYPLDDQFASYTDALKLASLQYEMYLHEQGKQQNNSWRMTVDGGTAPSNATAARVLPGTRDPIGFLYALRAIDWKSAPEFRAPVFDGHNLYEAEARLGQAAGHVSVPAGEFEATRVDVHLYEHGQAVSDTSFVLWIAQDAVRTPLLIEASVPVGTARVELTSH